MRTSKNECVPVRTSTGETNIDHRLGSRAECGTEASSIDPKTTDAETRAWDIPYCPVEQPRTNTPKYVQLKISKNEHRWVRTNAYKEEQTCKCGAYMVGIAGVHTRRAR